MTINAFAFMGKGNVFIDVLTDAGVSTGLQLKGNCTGLEIKTDSERKEMLGNGRDNYGQVVASAILPKPSSIKMQLNQLDSEMFALAFSGTAALLNQGAGSATAQVVVAKKGKAVELGKYNIAAAGFVVKNEAGSTTYVLNTDYEVNYRLGLLTALSTGAITDAQNLKVDYTYLATTGQTISGGTKTSLRAAIKLDGQNHIDGRSFILDVPQIRVAADNPVDFLKNEFLELSLSGVIEFKTGQSELFKLHYLD